MDIQNFKAGNYQKGYQYKYFLPSKINHSFYWTEETINHLLEKASLKIGELNAFSLFVPDTDLFILMHIYKEAVLSSRIEGTQTNIEEALMSEDSITPEKQNDRREVINYVQAMNTAIEKLKRLPLSNRLIKETHKILLSNVRGQHKNPGEFRRSQNWIGGASLSDAIFIPPPHNELPDLLSDFEFFLNNSKIKVPHLIKIAIAHYQFETIHPFLDGNGRMGRLLITLYLVSNGILQKPLLYLSDFFEKNKSLYYDNLNLVRTKNNLIQWIKFFLTGIIQTAEAAIQSLKKIIELKKCVENKILKMGKRSPQGLDLLQQLFSKPSLSVKDIQNFTGLSPKAAHQLTHVFLENKILVEITGYERNRIYQFEEYLKIFK